MNHLTLDQIDAAYDLATDLYNEHSYRKGWLAIDCLKIAVAIILEESRV